MRLVAHMRPEELARILGLPSDAEVEIIIEKAKDNNNIVEHHLITHALKMCPITALQFMAILDRSPCLRSEIAERTGYELEYHDGSIMVVGRTGDQ
jgi:hypothetical protein